MMEKEFIVMEIVGSYSNHLILIGREVKGWNTY